MAIVKLVQSEDHAPWKVGEIVTVQIAEVGENGEYGCSTLETFPPDLKQRHEAEIAVLISQGQQLQAQIVELQNQNASPSEPVN